MYSRLLVALFALLSLLSFARPVPLAIFDTTHSPDDGCTDPTPSPLSVPSTAPSVPSPSDDCSDPFSSLPPFISPTPTPTPTPTSTPAAAQSPSSASIPASSATPMSDIVDSANGPFTGGVATYYYQNNNAGACGEVNPDDAIICAMDQSRFGTSGPSSPLCGRQVQITNLNNNAVLTVTIADDCPTCSNANSIDLSVGAFQALTNDDLSIGEFPISWYFV